MPPPSAELVVLRVALESWIAVAHLKPKRRPRAFIETASRALATEEAVALTFPIRPKSEAAAVSKARREACAWWRQMLPIFIARLPPEV